MELVLVTIAGLAAAWVSFLALAWIFQRRMIYLPSTGPVLPASMFLPDADEIELETEDGLKLGAWHVPAASPEASHAVIVFNGNAGDRSMRAPLARRLSDEGFSVLLMDYRGYGGNPGAPSERGLRLDALAAHRWLSEHGAVPPERFVYFGESLGAAVSVQLAVEHPPAALVLRSPFTSLSDVARIHFPFLPVRALLRDRFPSLGRIPTVRCPVLVVAGEKDAIVPTAMSRRLWEAAPEPKRWVVLDGADHNDEPLLWGDRIIAESKRFIHAPGDSG